MNTHGKPPLRQNLKARELYRAGRFEEFVAACRDNVEWSRVRIGEHSMSVRLWLLQLATGFVELGKHAEALECQTEALDLLRQRQEQDTTLYAECLVLMGNSLRRLGRDVEAEARYVEALQILSGLPEEADAFRAGALTNYGILLRKQHRLREAETLLIQALPATLGKRSSALTAAVFGCLGCLYREWGKLRAAERCLVKAIRIYKRQRNADSRLYGQALMVLGGICESTSRIEEARSYYATAAEVFASSHPPCHDTSNLCRQKLRTVS